MATMDPSAPVNGREYHGYHDAPRHTVRIVVGWGLMVVLGLIGLGGALVMGLPSDPCGADLADCGPAPPTFAWVGWVLVGAAICAVWSVRWTNREQRYRFNPPPSWPEPPPGWRPPRGWVPPTSLPRAPEAWPFWA
ncbi:MAG: hypothetical protein ACTHN8_15330 [Angustibacter sp.]